MEYILVWKKGYDLEMVGFEIFKSFMEAEDYLADIDDNSFEVLIFGEINRIKVGRKFKIE